MDKLICLFVIMNISFMAHAAPQAADESGIEPEEGPFYVMDYDEFKNITKEQKSFYLGKLVVAIPEVPKLKDISKDQILAAGKSLEKWSDMADRIAKACYVKSTPETCQALKKARSDAFMYGKGEKLSQ